MSTLSISLGYHDFKGAMDKSPLRLEKAAMARSVAGRPLRLALIAGEELRLPRTLVALRVLSGRAWVSSEGSDLVLEAGDEFKVARARHAAIVSALGAEPLFFELA